ncbi:MAG: Fe-S cluster assembly ATP-binding protein [Candidatus Dependentiae bacterium]|nr:Fe-S cluster assembly ATP-binding protein [Candidatus Dependentiae bacterium]
MPARLKIVGLGAAIEDTQILQRVDLSLQPGEVHAIMGPNGSGKSTLAQVLMGHPSYTVTGGSIVFDGEEIGHVATHLRARKGMFLAFQYPYEIEGLPLKDLLRTAYNARYANTDKQIGIKAFHDLIQQKLTLLGLDPSFVERGVNAGFSGGEKKQAEVLQLAVLQPKLAILDEIDSGLDVDALRRVCNALVTVKKENPDMAILLITHYNRILDYIVPDRVHIMKKGCITQSGDSSLAKVIEHEGYSE